MYFNIPSITVWSSNKVYACEAVSRWIEGDIMAQPFYMRAELKSIQVSFNANGQMTTICYNTKAEIVADIVDTS